MNVKMKSYFNPEQVMILSPAFMNYVHLNWLGRKGQYPSTGFLTLIFSIYMCDEVGSLLFIHIKEKNATARRTQLN